MQKKKILEVINKIEDETSAFLQMTPEHIYPGITGRQHPLNKECSDETRAVSHVHSMCRKMRTLTYENKTGKVYRWIGFAQGVMWSCGIVSINDLHRMNMPDDVEFKK